MTVKTGHLDWSKSLQCVPVIQFIAMNPWNHIILQSLFNELELILCLEINDMFHLSRLKYTYQSVMSKCTIRSETVQNIVVLPRPSETVLNSSDFLNPF